MRAPAAVVSLFLLGCGSSSSTPHDAGDEAPGPDAAVTDTAGPRADTAASAPDMTGAAPDAQAGDASASVPGCPGPEAYVGNPAWKDALVVGPGAQMCARWVESNGTLDKNSTVNSLAGTLARKVMSRIAAGTYKLPDATGSMAFGLPVCLSRAEGAPRATGTGTVARGAFGGATTFQISLPVTGMGVVRSTLVKQGASPLTIDGVDNLQHCPDGKCDPGVGIYFTTCFHGGNMLKHTVTFDGGSVELISTIDQRGLGAGTEPGDFHRASGTFRGTAFDQRDYFKLIYSPEHHHFVRNYAVFFDAPIGGACGLEVVNLPGDQRAVHVYAVDCKLTRQSELAVSSVKMN